MYGGYARGALHRGDLVKAQESLATGRALIRKGWGADSEAYRMFFTTQFIPNATAEQQRWFNELEAVAATPGMAERFLQVTAQTNVVGLLPQLHVPTLVLHCRGDARVPFSEGRELAAGIAGAKLVALDSKNHLFLANEPAHRAFFDAVNEFLGDPPRKGTLPGTERPNRVDTAVTRVHQNWVVKVIGIIAAIGGVSALITRILGR